MTKRGFLVIVLLSVLFFGGLSFVSALEDGSQFVADISSGVTRTYYAGNVLGFNLFGGRHTFLMMGIKDDIVNVKIAEPAQTAAMSVGEEKRFDFNGDGVMDVYVKINSVKPSGVTNVADITVRTIAEPATPAVVEPVAPEPAAPEPAAPVEEQNENITGDLVDMETAGESSNVWIWVVAGIVLAAAVFGFMRFRKKR